MNDIERKREEIEQEWICRECGLALSVEEYEKDSSVCERCIRAFEIEMAEEGDWWNEYEEFCTDCGAPESECMCPRLEPLDDVDANTRGDAW